MEHVAQTTPEGIQQDTRAAVEYLRSPAGGACTTVFTVGFCFGGRNSWLAAAGGHGLAGAIGFYGSTGERNGTPGPTQRAAEFEAPILALQAGVDQNILPEHNAAFEAALVAAGVEHELVVYEGAPHSFFDRRYEEYADASADAWERVLAFIARHTPLGLVSRGSLRRRALRLAPIERCTAATASSGQTRSAVRTMVSTIERIMAPNPTPPG